MPSSLLSHQAAVLPPKLRHPDKFDGTALCVGSIAPDLALIISPFYKNHINPYVFHSVGGLVYTIPISLFLVILLKNWLFPAVAHLVKKEKDSLFSRWLTFLGFDPYYFKSSRGFSPQWLVKATYSVLTGIFTHFLLDLPTHSWIPYLSPFYNGQMPEWFLHRHGELEIPFYRVVELTNYNLLWFLFSIVLGILALHNVWYMQSHSLLMRWRHERNSEEVSSTEEPIKTVQLSSNSINRTLIMIPTLNEESGIAKVLEEMPDGPATLVVDGGSTDRTVEVAKQHHAKVITQKFGKGKGCGVRTGMEYFLGTDYAMLCMIDGDGSNDPREIPTMIEALEATGAEVLLGSRTRGKKEEGAMGPFTILSNLIVSLLLGLRFLRLFTDVQTGYWAFTRTAVETLYPDLGAEGFEIEMELFVQTFRASLKCIELPVRYGKRSGTTKFRLSLRFRNFCFLIYYWLRSFWPR